MKKRFLSIITALALCLSLLPTAALAADTVTGVPYLDETGDEKTCARATVVESNTINWGVRTWYVVQGTVEINRRVIVYGDVHLILTDGCELIINGGIEMEDDDTDPDNGSRNALTIYGQAGGTGKLTTRNVEDYDAGIGGTISSADGHGCGEITINGGYIEATSIFGAGIGGGWSSGTCGYGGSVTINGGFVKAISTYGAGIGGGGGAIGGHAIGGAGGEITITGGTVTATSTYGAGIGGGCSPGTGGIADSGTFQTSNGSAVIFASSIGDQSGKESNAWSGVIFEGDSGAVYGDQTLTGDLTIPEGKALTVPEDKTLTVPEGKTLTIPEVATLTNNGTINNFGTIVGTVGGNQPKNFVSAEYLDEDGAEQTCNTAIVVTSEDTTWTTGWYVVTGDVTMGTADAPKRVTVTGDVHLILADGCNFTVKGGIQVQDDDADITNGSANALAIYAQSTEESTMGRLTAQNAAKGNAGIGGGGYGGNGGTITINGGTVKATGGDGAAIGGGGSSSSGGYNAGGSGGTITINGGSVTATCDSGGGAGIGGGVGLDWGIGGYGAGGSGGTITINGGTVNATSTTGAGIGGGGGNNGGIGGEITISGGTVETTSIGGGKSISSEQNGAPGTFQTTNNGSAVIFASSIGDQSGKESDAWSGIIFEGDADGKVYGTSVTPIEDFTIDSGKTLLIPESAALTIADITAVNSGSVYVDGALTGTVSGDGGVYYPLTVNGGTATGTLNLEQHDGKTYAKAGSEITLTPDTPTGYKLTQWSSVPVVTISENNTFTMPSAALTVTAQFSKIYYITYELNGGTINGDYDASYTYGQSVTLPTNVTKAGYTFAGWYDNETVTGDPVTEVSADDTGDKTFWAKWTKNSSGGGVSTYAITLESAKNGTVTMMPKTASKGTTVTLTVKPDKGYTLETLTVTDRNGNEIELTAKGDGKFTFKMPGSKVAVKATFMEDNSMLNFFVDVPASAYYYDAVLWAAENGITGGVDDTHFAPNAPCTRAQIVTFLWRAAGCPEPESLTSLSDVPDDAYYAKAVAWAVEQGITTGTGNGTFSPNATCTRAQAMAFIYRSEQARGGGMQGAWMFLNPFDDVNLESYYGEAVMWAVANGVTDGTTATTFSPNANCTRAQIVTFLFRCLGDE
ncbi:S-layer homology domain-containing protein [Oscillibacter valericigenes]|uniref:S-layer homology domain-containing protein n=1 Tax=Oscillibacter valericigenes TaxID=351091 RepID=UPI0022861589|nr:S-layer homology domain-containing protein [Oscillibacter valericigenes]MCF2665327.1 S-layer homology domain-containing protein [Oscillibacter valericigenes]